MSVVGGLNAPLKVGKVAVATGKTFESYSYDLFDDDDIFAESYDDYDDIFEESFNDLFDYDDPFDDIHSI